nr:hypothetical protein [uncultured Campylobacter sp.]
MTRTNLNALSASKFKGNLKEACAKFIPSSRLNFMTRAPAPYQI